MATKRQPPVVVRSAAYARGYSGADHLLSDSDLADVVGRVYPTAAAAREATETLSRESVPVRVDTVAIDAVPEADLRAALDRVCGHMHRRGGAVAPVRPAELRPYREGNRLMVLVPLGHGPGEDVAKGCRAPVYLAR